MLSISQPHRPGPATTLAIVVAELRQCLDRSPHRTGPMSRRATLDRSADRQPQQEMDLSLCSRSSMSSLRGVRLLPQHCSFVVRPPVRAVTRSTPVLQAMRFSHMLPRQARHCLAGTSKSCTEQLVCPGVAQVTLARRVLAYRAFAGSLQPRCLDDAGLANTACQVLVQEPGLCA